MMFSFFGSTLSRYLARIYAFNFIAMMLLLAGIVFLFDTVELLRRSTGREGIGFSLLIKMSLLKLPDVMNTIAPFAVLFSALFTFWQLSRRQELVVLRSAGISVWQFLSPILLVALAAGAIMVTVLNPLGAALYTKYAQLEQKFLKSNDTSIVAIFDQGLWLRQEVEGGYTVLHAARIDPDWRLLNVMALFYDNNDSFSKRLDSSVAELTPGKWVLKDSVLNIPNEKSRRLGRAEIKTSLTPNEIEDSFSSPRSMGFWALPSFIQTLDNTGFDSTRLRIHFQSLLAQPFLYMAMIILAACVALRQQRQGQTFAFVVIGIMTGFTVFILSNFLQALGTSHQLPVFLAAWSPALIASMLGSTVLLTFEDG